MSDELDLRNKKWIHENEIYLISITESLKENYPDADIEKELEEAGYVLDDLLQVEKTQRFINILFTKYPYPEDEN
jgi:hypothetical protein